MCELAGAVPQTERPRTASKEPSAALRCRTSKLAVHGSGSLHRPLRSQGPSGTGSAAESVSAQH